MRTVAMRTTKQAILAAAVVAVAGLSTDLRAATFTFDSGTSWNTATNWDNSGDPATPPTSADNVLFQSVVPATLTLDANQSIQYLTFDSASSMQVNGNAIGTTARTLTLGAVDVNGNLINHTGTGALTFSTTGGDANIALGASGNFNVSDSAGTLAISSTISGSGFGINKTGDGTLTLTSTSNSFTGGVTISGGVLGITALANGGSNSQLGASSNAAANLVIDGGTLRRASGGTAQSTNRLFTIGGAGGTIDASAGGFAFTNSGANVSGGSGDRTLTLTASSPAADEDKPVSSIAGSFGDPGAGKLKLVKAGNGIWSLAGNSTFTGGIDLNAGTLIAASANALGNSSVNAAANGATNVTGPVLSVANGITVSNSISLSGTGYARVGGGGTLSGNITSGTGKLAVAQNGFVILSGNNAALNTLVEAPNNSNSFTTVGIGSDNALGTVGLTFTNIQTGSTVNFRNILRPYNGTRTISVPVTFVGPAVFDLAPGDSNLTLTNNVSGTGIMAVSAGATASTVTISGTLSGTTLDLGKRELSTYGNLTNGTGQRHTGALVLGGTNTYNNTTRVIEGTLGISANANSGSGALGTATSAVLLGDHAPQLGAVRVATTVGLTGTFTSGTLDTSASPVASIDGVSGFALNDRILVKNNAGAQNGVYRVSAVDGSGQITQLIRVAELDQTGEMRYGIVVPVTSGTTLGGQRWFVNQTSAMTINSTDPSLRRDITNNPSVALVNTVANITNARAVIASGNGTGTTTIGGTHTSGTSTFSGAITLGSGTFTAGNSHSLVTGKSVNLTAAGTSTVEFTGAIADPANLNPGGGVIATSAAGTVTKVGTGTVIFTNNMAYTGGTLVQEGKLVVNNGLASSLVNVTGGTLAGSGTIAGAVTINNGGTIAPGNSPGPLTVGDLGLAGGGTYEWEINNSDGAAGTNWDLISGTGTLDITATSGSPFTIKLISLTSGNVAGVADGFLGSDYAWKIADFANPITGYAADKFALNFAGFQNTLSGATWNVVRGESVAGGDNTQLYITAVIPEPSSLLAMGFGFAAFVTCRRRRMA